MRPNLFLSTLALLASASLGCSGAATQADVDAAWAAQDYDRYYELLEHRATRGDTHAKAALYPILLDGMIRDDRTDGVVAVARADTARARGLKTDVTQAYSDTLEVNPQSVQANLWIGQRRRDEGDFSAAAEHFERAATLGSNEAKFLLAAMQCLRVYACPEQSQQALGELAEAGDPAGANMYGSLLLSGFMEVEPDTARALRYLQMASDKGSVPARRRLTMYQHWLEARTAAPDS